MRVIERIMGGRWFVLVRIIVWKVEINLFIGFCFFKVFIFVRKRVEIKLNGFYLFI